MRVRLETELSGEFDFNLLPGLVARDAIGSQSRQTGFELFASLQDQLGLELESTRADVDVLVIRRIVPPTAN